MKHISVDGTSIITDSTHRFVTDVQIGLWNKGIGFTEVTYSELVALINSNGLTPLFYYKITDFRTVHYIVGGSSTETGDINTGILEPLIVQAIDVNKIGANAYSQLFPYDLIEYDWNPISFEKHKEIKHSTLGIVAGFKGIITNRIDTIRDVEVGYDYRNVKFRRYEVNAPTWTNSTTFYTDDLVTFNSIIYISLTDDNINNQPDTSTTQWKPILLYSSRYICVNKNDPYPTTNNYQDFYTFSNLNNVYSVHIDKLIEGEAS